MVIIIHLIIYIKIVYLFKQFGYMLISKIKTEFNFKDFFFFFFAFV